ncbi:MAG: RNA methyltransferase [Algicola sp.]|nr:RNA methyltransferase [Algicola sp.]
MLSKNQIKLINSLGQKKYRQKHRLFVAEGIKTIGELLNSEFKLHQVFTTAPFDGVATAYETRISPAELNKISFLKSPNTALALFSMPEEQELANAQEGLTVALDGIQDPGNLGTIIRLCDWFGVTQLVCSLNTVDCYNPKVIQATMGSIKRVRVCYHDLEAFLGASKQPVFGAFMDGENVYGKSLPQQGILVMGNEANGISAGVKACITEKLAIPQFGVHQETESLNVATATAILLSEFKRATGR